MMQMADSWKGGAPSPPRARRPRSSPATRPMPPRPRRSRLKLRTMEATVAKTKMLVNVMAQEVQHECEVLSAMPFGNAQELVQSRIKMGLSQNIADRERQLGRTGRRARRAAQHPQSGCAHRGPPRRRRPPDKGREQAMQMMMQMGQMAMQLPAADRRNVDPGSAAAHAAAATDHAAAAAADVRGRQGRLRRVRRRRPSRRSPIIPWRVARVRVAVAAW